MIYVDSPVFKKSPNGRKAYAHMVGDTVAEVSAFALKIGVKQHFWHRQGDLSHFDITEEQHAAAMKEGASLVNSRELVRKAKAMNSVQTPPVAL